MSEYEVFYHYTTKEEAEDIETNKKIIALKLEKITRDARFDDGVYFTKLSPSYGKEIVAMNKWGARYEENIKNGRMEYVVKVIFKKGACPQKPSDAGNRSIYLINGDVHLEQDLYEIIRV